MKVNGEAIYGTQGSPLPPLPWGRCTQKKKDNSTTLYLHIFDWPADGKLHVPGIKEKVRNARLLAGGQTLSTTARADELIIDLPPQAPDKIATVVAVSL